MRERLRDASIDSYSTPMRLGQPLVGFGLVLVLRSEKEGVKAGDYMYGFTPWEAYTVQPYMEDFPAYTFDMDSLLFLIRKASFRGHDTAAAWVLPGQTIYVSSGASGVGRLEGYITVPDIVRDTHQVHYRLKVETHPMLLEEIKIFPNSFQSDSREVGGGQSMARTH
ncbi:hypothetical protein DFH09DRAFT_1082910 [Mycena vulgaris]|nr:hypothetical protein DFH09DRAFT_1082910 [Mycena vulgaris]